MIFRGKDNIFFQILLSFIKIFLFFPQKKHQKPHFSSLFRDFNPANAPFPLVAKCQGCFCHQDSY